MRRVLLAVALVVGLAALAQVVPFSLSGPIFRNPATMSSLGALPYVPDILWAPTRTYRTATAQIDAGTGLPVAQELCDAVTADDKTAPWECFRPDAGTDAWDGGTSVYAAVGSPVGVVATLCPSGPSCDSRLWERHVASSSGRASLAHASGTDAITACWLGRIDGAVNTWPVFTQSTGSGAATISWYLEAGAAATTFYVSDGTTLGSASYGAAVPVSGAEHCICGTWSAATGIRACFDGVCTAPVARATRQSLTAAPTIKGINAASAATVTVQTRGAFLTHEELSTARIDTLCSAVLADQPFVIRSDGGTANVVTTRATATSCDSSNGDGGAGGSILPPNRFCVTQQGGRPFSQVQNLAVRPDEFDNAGWTAVGTPTESANTALSPWGLLTADTVGDDDATAIEGESQTLATSAGQPYTLSVYAKTGTGSELRLDNDGTVCDFATTATLMRYECTDASASGASTVQQILYGNAVGDTGNLILASAQFNAGAKALPYCPGTSGAATCNADVPVATVDGTPLAPLSLAGNRIGSSASSAAARVLISVRSAAIGEFRGYVPASSTAMGCRVDGGAAATTGTIDGEDDMDCKWDGTNLTACLGDSCAVPTTPGHAVATSTKVGIGVDPQNSDDQANGVVRDLRVCVGAGGCLP